MVATFGWAGPSLADERVDEEAREARRPKTEQMESVPVGVGKMEAGLPDPADGPVAKVDWPEPAVATVTVPAPDGAKPASATGEPGGLPIKITTPQQPGAIRVEVLDRATTEQAGVDGVLLSVTRPGGAPAGAGVELELDYAGFAHAYGGDWASRLRVNSLPACALTTPDVPACRSSTPLDTRNDLDGERLSARVPTPPAATALKSKVSARSALSAAASAGAVGLLSVSAGAKGGSGSYAATSLAPSGSWQNSGNTGGFSWSYPLRVPPALAGPSPQLAFGYSSASVDGRTGSTNNQPSVVGEGFDMSVGFIERSFKSCNDDGHDEAGEQKYDLCYASDNATMSFAGRSGELVKKSGNEWRLKSDDGTRITKETGGFNDDNNDEYWLVTTTEGTRYYFGKGKRSAADAENTNSSWEVPVYGDDANEPCHQDTFKESRCKQTWRWNLDYVVDTHGNTMTYYWGTETNRYGANRDDVSVSYDRGGYLKRIEYGERAGAENDTKAPAQVVFSVAERCKGADEDCEAGDLKKDTATRWPDVPFDQICTDDETCEEQWSPTFFTRKRLATVTTQVLGKDGGYDNVDVWSLDHSYPDPADASTASLWLDSITHTGKGSGSSITLPKTTFQSIALENRVDRDGDDRLPFKKFRIRAIQSESGGITSVNYTPAECTPAEVKTLAPATNDRRCYPSFWSKEGQIGEKEDWFHKYLVDSVVEDDRTGNSVDKVTRYEYLGGAAWHYDDSEIAKAKTKTWGQFRGYQTVRTITGAAGSVQLRTESTYLRGMDDDRESKDGGKKSVSVTASDGTKVTDHERYQGFLLEQRTFDGISGPEVNGLVNSPWLSEPTATEGADEARLLSIGKTVSRTALDGGKVRRTAVTHEYDGYGMLKWSSDAGDLDVDDDQACTRNWYNRNTDKTILTLVSRVQTVAVACDKTAAMPGDSISDVRTYYDKGAFEDTPTKGDVTRTEQVESYTGSTPRYLKVAESTYDAYGRLRFSYDADMNETETAYLPAAGGPVTGMKVTDPLGLSTTTTVDPAWGLVTQTKDANGQRTLLKYDALGRLNKVWLAGRTDANVPDIEHTYDIRLDRPVAVTTKTLTPNDGVRTTHQLYDGLLRSLQSQAPTPNLGRIINSTTYDSRGLAIAQIGPFYNKDAPDTNFADTSKSAEGVPTATETVYDAVGRAREEIFKVAGTEKWRTSTSYHGDHTNVTPPKGETPFSSYSNAQGKTTKLLEFKGATPAGDADTTVYAYDKADRLSQVTDASGNVWKYGYDLLGRKTSAQDPDAGDTSTKYNKLDQVETATDGRGRTLGYTYDDLGRPTLLEEVPATPGAARTRLASWTYDTAIMGKGQVATSTRYVGTAEYQSAVSEYDVAGRPKKTTVTIPAVENKLAGTYTFGSTYNVDGSPDEASMPAAGDLPAETVRTGYNAFGLPSFTSGTTGYVRSTSYSNLSEPLQLTLGTSSASKQTWLTYGYEAGTRRMNSVMVDREIVTGNDANVKYAYDAAGNIMSIADKPTTAGAKADVQCFQYDYLRRLKEAWAQGTDCAAGPSVAVLGGAAPYWQSFAYNAAGDRTEEVNHRTTATGTDVKKVYKPFGVGKKPAHAVERTETTTSGATTTAVDTFGYDLSGNTTKRALAGKAVEEYKWDAEGRLAEVLKAGKTTASFLYDASGGRLIRRDLVNKSVTLYLDGTEIKLDTTNADVTKQTTTAARYYGHNGQVVAVRMKAGVTWLAGGQNGTAEIAVNAADSKVVQRRTLPFGGFRGSAVTWPGEKGFVGGTLDAVTSLIHVGAREYDPATGRFLSVDPVIDFSDPQQLNAYAYGRNNPFSYPDPTGMWWGWSNAGHLALDIIGLVPVVGEVADGINGVWYLAEGNYVDAGLSFASMIPIAGYGASAAKGLKYADEALDTVDVAVDTVKAADKAADATTAAKSIVPPSTPKPRPPPKPAPPAKPKAPPKAAKDTAAGKPAGNTATKEKPKKGDDGDDPDFVEIYKAPVKGGTAKIKEKGFQPEDYPGTPGAPQGSLDGSAYFGMGNLGRDIAESYRGRAGYDGSLMRIRIPKAEFDQFFRQHVGKYDGIEGGEVAIPKTKFDILNRYKPEWL